MRWNRFDICEAFYVLEVGYNVGGLLVERRSARERNGAIGRHSIGSQLARMRFQPSVDVANNGYRGLSENGASIYRAAVRRYGLPVPWRELEGVELADWVASEPYAWPGGYEIFAITADGATLCYECCGSEREQIQKSNGSDGWAVVGFSHTGETDAREQCDHCSRVILGAAGEE